MIAAGSIALILALLAVGGYALYGALTSKTQPPPGVAVGTTPSAPASVGTASPAAPPTLELRVTGPRSDVLVRVPGGRVLLQRTLVRGQTVRFDDPRLDVTLGDAGAVQVIVNGTPRPRGRPGQRTEFTVTRGG